MPTYDFVCQDCKKASEVRMSISDYSEGARPQCDQCGSEKVERTFTAVNVLTSGRGSSASSSGPACGRRGFT